MVQRLFAFVVLLHGVDATGLANGVQFVDKNDARRLLLRLLEQVPYPSRAYAHKHFHKIGTAQAEEGHGSFAGHRSGQQRFSRPGWSYQQYSLGYAAAEAGVLLRVAQKINYFLQFLFRLIRTGYI